jgi:preprotein translocase subunit Sec63
MTDGSSPLVRLLFINLGWFFLPQWATNITVMAYHFCRRLSNSSYQPPSSGSPQALKIWRYSYAFLMVGYLLSTLLYAFVTMPPNFYETLGIAPNADELAIKAAYKRFARRLHPDRAGPQGEALFIEIRKIYEALNNPVKRFAYDRYIVFLNISHLCL